MDKIPFFSKFVIYFPIVSGIFVFVYSFSKNQHAALVASLGENTANKAHFLFRYGGPVLVLIGIIQYLIKDI
jgi:hypothetical protein